MRPDLEDWAENKFNGDQAMIEWYILKYHPSSPMAQRIKTRRFIYKIFKKVLKFILKAPISIISRGNKDEKNNTGSNQD